MQSSGPTTQLSRNGNGLTPGQTSNKHLFLSQASHCHTYRRPCNITTIFATALFWQRRFFSNLRSLILLSIDSISASIWVVSRIFSLFQIRPLWKCKIISPKFFLSEKIFLINVSSKLVLSNKKRRGFESREGFYSTRGLHFLLDTKSWRYAFFDLCCLFIGGIYYSLINIL